MTHAVTHSLGQLLEECSADNSYGHTVLVTVGGV